MRKTRTIILLATSAALAGCAAQSRQAPNPVWVSSKINGLQQSACNCGGIELKKDFKKRRKAEAKVQEEAWKNLNSDRRK